MLLCWRKTYHGVKDERRTDASIGRIMTADGIDDEIERHRAALNNLSGKTELNTWLFLRSISGVLLTAGHIVFAVSFTLLLLKAGSLRTEPTLFGSDQGRQPEPLNV